MAGLASPSAARVPSVVASTVAETPMVKLLTIANSHCSSPKTLRYQRSE